MLDKNQQIIYQQIEETLYFHASAIHLILHNDLHIFKLKKKKSR